MAFLVYIVDTAAVYKNESDIGDCLNELLPKHNLKREDIFITTKLGLHFYFKYKPFFWSIITKLNFFTTDTYM